jgi:hypothetical protein
MDAAELMLRHVNDKIQQLALEGKNIYRQVEVDSGKRLFAYPDLAHE